MLVWVQSTLVAVMLILLMAPRSTFAAVLRRWFVLWPAQQFARLTVGQILIGAAMTAFVGLVLWAMRGEGIILLSWGAPEIATWLTLFDVSAYLDIMAAAVLTASTTRLKLLPVPKLGGLRRIITSALRRPRHARRPRLPRGPSNDDEPALLLLAA